MSALVSVTLFAALVPAIAWAAATSLRRQPRSRAAYGPLRAAGRVAFWTFGVLLLRDHLARAVHADATSGGDLEALLISAALLLLARSLMRVEKLKWSGLGMTRRGALKDLLAGLGLGLGFGVLLLESGALERLPLVPGAGLVARLAFAASLALASELVGRGLIPALTRRKLPASAALILSGAIGASTWLGLALFGPLPTFSVLAFAGWRACASTVAFRWLGFPGGLGAAFGVLFLLLRP